jgi:regulator of RNase E activity RraA
VQFGGRTISPGNLIVGDDDGLAVLTPSEAYEPIDGSQRQLEKEVNWLQDFADGRTLGCL